MIKKSIALLAFTGVLGASVAQADATLYGSVRMKVDHYDNKGETDVKDNASRIGIKGSQELYSGAKSICRGEWKVNNNDDGGVGDGRLWYAGIEGSYGTLKVGKQWTPLYNATSQTDVNNNSNESSTYNSTQGWRADNMIAYYTPRTNGFQAAMAVISDASPKNKENVDAQQFTLSYVGDSLNIGAGLATVKKTNSVTNKIEDKDMTVLGLSYKLNDELTFAARSHKNEENGKGEDASEFVVSYQAAPNTTLVANYVDDENSDAYHSNKNARIWAVEVVQQLGAKAQGIFAYVDKGDDDGVEAIYRVDF